MPTISERAEAVILRLRRRAEAAETRAQLNAAKAAAFDRVSQRCLRAETVQDELARVLGRITPTLSRMRHEKDGALLEHERAVGMRQS